MKSETVHQRLRSKKTVCDVFNENIILNFIHSWQDLWESSSVFGSELITFPENLVTGTTRKKVLG